jgi:hypothetical protein
MFFTARFTQETEGAKWNHSFVKAPFQGSWLTIKKGSIVDDGRQKQRVLGTGFKVFDVHYSIHYSGIKPLIIVWEPDNFYKAWHPDGVKLKFKNVILLLIDFFNSHEMDYALTGAFALRAYGYLRATQDVDFVVRQAEQP